MKKIGALLSFLILFTIFFTCENEPLDGDFTEESAISCEDTTLILATITANFANVTTDDANYSQLCLAYRNALQNQIDACGDDNGALQVIINSLENCGLSDCEIATIAVTESQIVYINNSSNASLCNVYKAALQNQITVCGDTDGSIQAIIDGLNCTSTTPADHHALMTANLNGEQLDNLKPNGYNFFNTAILMNTFSTSNDETYIKLQGNSTYYNVNVTEYTKEINLFIPETSWALGTYPLSEDITYSDSVGGITPHFTIYYWNNDEYTSSYGLEGGTITITKFDLAERVIQGTFEFQYERYSDTSVVGPFDCINGTFDYSLDDEYFD